MSTMPNLCIVDTPTLLVGKDRRQIARRVALRVAQPARWSCSEKRKAPSQSDRMTPGSQMILSLPGGKCQTLSLRRRVEVGW